MKFSVIVPVYNAEKYLSNCIESIINDKQADLELILVDDGSCDASGKICDEYKDKDKRISVYHKNNGGANSARRYAAGKAKGDFIVSIDSDDMLKADFFKVIGEITQKHNVEVITFLYDTIDEKGKKTEKSAFNFLDAGEYSSDKLKEIKDGFLYDKKVKGINHGLLPYSLWTKVIKKDLYLSAIERVPNVKFGEDMLLTKRILDDERLKTLYVSDYVGYLYRDNLSSVLNTATIESLCDYEKTVAEMEKCFSDKND